MLIIRPTASLAKKMGLKLKADLEKSTTRLGDWFCLDLSLGHHRYILCVSENARVPILLPAAPYAQLPKRLPVAVRQTLCFIGIPENLITQELEEMAEVRVAKTNNGSVLGSMNQFRYELECLHQMERLNHDQYQDISFFLVAETISSVVQYRTPQ